MPDYADHVRNRTDLPPAVVFKYMSTDTALKILASGQFRWSSPLGFNDPFDHQCDPMWQMRTSGFLKKLKTATVDQLLGDIDWNKFKNRELKKHISKMRVLLAEFGYEERLRRAEAFASKQVENHLSLRMRFREEGIFAAGLRNQRVLCVSQVCDCPLMWAHYSENHKGVQIALDCRKLESWWKVPARRVNYCSKFPEFMNIDKALEDVIWGYEHISGTLQYVDQWALGKASGWSYESEWRFITSIEDGQLWTGVDFPKDAIVGVSLGFQASAETRSRIGEQLRQIGLSVPVHQVEPHPFEFKLRTPGPDPEI